MTKDNAGEELNLPISLSDWEDAGLSAGPIPRYAEELFVGPEADTVDEHLDDRDFLRRVVALLNDTFPS